MRPLCVQTNSGFEYQPAEVAFGFSGGGVWVFVLQINTKCLFGPGRRAETLISDCTQAYYSFNGASVGCMHHWYAEEKAILDEYFNKGGDGEENELEVSVMAVACGD